jgi:alpha-N-arabinofuranosidase
MSIPAGNIWSDTTVAIDVTKTGEPISKYIYGQFIEHLGRCIYGGIWAEMLEDRKFYYPITNEFKPWGTFNDRSFWSGGEFPILTGSPWKVIGGEQSVHMLKKNAFVGEQTPEIRQSGAPGGIEQGELALLAGKEYVGYVYVCGDMEAAPIQVSLIWGDRENDKLVVTIPTLKSDYQKQVFYFRAKENTTKGILRITGSGKGTYRIGTVSLMPTDNVKGFRPDTLILLKELDSPVYRWPGGNFVSDYNWKDGVGDRDKRPPRKNPAWTGIEPNDVGIHEFIDLCELLDTEPYIAVNTGLGSVELAAEQVEYCNGAADTKMGKWRAENGRPEPFCVIWWAIGNEMYGDWQKGHMPLEEYVKKNNRCVELIRAVDPSTKLIAVGSVGDWSKTMLTHCGDHMDLISEHIYRKNKKDLAEHVAQIPDDIKRVADAHREYRKTIDGLAQKDIRIAMDEWNYWYGRYIYGELGVQYYLQDALGIAAGLHEYFRNSDIYFMANYAQTVNVIGAIKTNKTEAQMETTGLALQLYRHHFGVIPVEVKGVEKPLDVAAALTADKKSMTIAVVNPTNTAMTLDLNIQGAELKKEGIRRTISGNDKMLHNAPGKEQVVNIVENQITRASNQLRVEPISVTLYTFDVQ